MLGPLRRSSGAFGWDQSSPDLNFLPRNDTGHSHCIYRQIRQDLLHAELELFTNLIYLPRRRKNFWVL
jgi:hypothetical protein